MNRARSSRALEVAEDIFIGVNALRLWHQACAQGTELGHGKIALDGFAHEVALRHAGGFALFLERPIEIVRYSKGDHGHALNCDTAGAQASMAMLPRRGDAFPSRQGRAGIDA